MSETFTYTRGRRRVTYEVIGPPSPNTVLYFHGFPSSRIEATLHAEQAHHAGAQIIAIDRPGYGGSDPAPKATIVDVATEALEVADALGIERVGVVGVSGGGPYALATAGIAPDRVRGVALMAPLAPPEAERYGMRPANRLMLSVAGRSRIVFGAMQRVAARVVRADADRVVRTFAKTLPRIEERLVDNDVLRQRFCAVIETALAQEGRGATADGRRLARSWDVDPSSVRVPVRIWHGLLDDIVPPGMGGYLQRSIGEGTDLVIAPSTDTSRSCATGSKTPCAGSRADATVATTGYGVVPSP